MSLGHFSKRTYFVSYEVYDPGDVLLGQIIENFTQPNISLIKYPQTGPRVHKDDGGNLNDSVNAGDDTFASLQFSFLGNDAAGATANRSNRYSWSMKAVKSFRETIDPKKDDPTFIQRSIDEIFTLRVTEGKKPWTFKKLYMITGRKIVPPGSIFSISHDEKRGIEGNAQVPIDPAGAVQFGPGVGYKPFAGGNHEETLVKDSVYAYQLIKILVWRGTAFLQRVKGGGQLHGVDPYFEGSGYVKGNSYVIDDDDFGDELRACADVVEDNDRAQCALLPPATLAVDSNKSLDTGSIPQSEAGGNDFGEFSTSQLEEEDFYEREKR
jgi:hypothetical protein